MGSSAVDFHDETAEPPTVTAVESEAGTLSSRLRPGIQPPTALGEHSTAN
jgi:hypothetical protein